MAGEQRNQQQELASTGKPGTNGAPPIRFSCPSCRMVLEVPFELAGVRGPCPGCAGEITAPPAPGPKPIEIKPRPHRPGRAADSPAQAGRETPFTPASLPIPTLGTPPPPPAPVEAKPPVPRQAPIPPVAKVPPWPGNLEEQADWGTAPSSRRGSRGQSRLGCAVDPSSTFSARHRDRQEVIALVKIVLAVIATLVLVIVIAKMTKKNVLGPSRHTIPEDIERPDYRR